MLTVAGLLFGWERALYSIIFQFTSTQTIRLLDPDSGRATLFIVTGRETGGGRVCPDTGYPPYRYFDRGGWPVQWGALRHDLYGGQRGRKQGPGP